MVFTKINFRPGENRFLEMSFQWRPLCYLKKAFAKAYSSL